VGLQFISGDGYKDRWDQIVEAAYFSDIFHSYGYTKVFAEYESAKPELVVYQEGDYFIALPLLIRRIPVAGDFGADWFDATSVYGYAGPIASHRVEDLPSDVIVRFQAELHRALAERKIVSLFCRLHPLMAQARLINGLGSGALRAGETVSIDLTLPPEEQWRMMRRNHRQDISKILSLGVRCDIDSEWEFLDQFIEMYQANMRRLDADPWYYFNEQFFHSVETDLSGNFYLFICTLNDEICCGLIASLFGGVAHSFLSAPNLAAKRLPAVKVVFNAARLWAKEQGAHTLFLGGGVGSSGDSLFHFKSGFSDRRHDFSVWRWVIMPEQYQVLCRLSGEAEAGDGSGTRFPAYRFAERSNAPAYAAEVA
jgi:hypothetical protein